MQQRPYSRVHAGTKTFSDSLVSRHALAQAESAEKHKLMTAFLLKHLATHQEACIANGSHQAGYALASVE